MPGHPFRIFISYSHEDKQLALIASEALSNLGYHPLWDSHIHPGTAFSDAIKGLIHHAHIFMPLITESAAQRPWVHQETGYAMALSIPILPVSVDEVPGQMTADLLALVVKNDFADFKEKISALDLEKLVLGNLKPAFSNIEVSDWAENRTEMLVQHANRVLELKSFGRVRQRASLSSFSIPDKDPSHSIWDQREGNVPRSPFYRNLLRNERRALEAHARTAGCDLIIDPEFCLERNGVAATHTRLCILTQFLESMPDEVEQAPKRQAPKVRVALSPQARSGNLTIIGDWFSAESVSPRPGEGHRQTVFNWHAPSVLHVLRQFDEEFSDLMRESGVQPENSRQHAIDRIRQILAG
jgi:hypothetical protein